MDFVAFSKGDVHDLDPEEIVIVFVTTSPSLADVIEKVRSELNWMDKNDVVHLKGRYNVGFGHYIRWEMMTLDSESHWQAYMEVVFASQDKSLELFATKKVGARLHIDLNRPIGVNSPGLQDEEHVSSEADVYETTMSQPPISQPPMSQRKEALDDDAENDETEGDATEDPGGNPPTVVPEAVGDSQSRAQTYKDK